MSRIASTVVQLHQPDGDTRQLSSIQYIPGNINDMCVATQPGGTAPPNLGSLNCRSFANW
jgi:hypothetical protein